MSVEHCLDLIEGVPVERLADLLRDLRHCQERLTLKNDRLYGSREDKIALVDAYQRLLDFIHDDHGLGALSQAGRVGHAKHLFGGETVRAMGGFWRFVALGLDPRSPIYSFDGHHRNPPWVPLWTVAHYQRIVELAEKEKDA